MNYVIQYKDGRTQTLEADAYRRDPELGWLVFRVGGSDVLLVDFSAIESIRQGEIAAPKRPTATVSGGSSAGR